MIDCRRDYVLHMNSNWYVIRIISVDKYSLFSKFLQEIASDGGAQLTSHMITKLMQKYGVKHRVTSPYHPQVNGQVESTNKTLENILTKNLAYHHRDWAQKLPEAL